MDQVEIAEKFLVTVRNQWKTGDASLFISMLYHFVALPIPCRIMKANGILDLVVEKLAHTALVGPHRPRLLRIKSFLSRA
jgi:hypothetical protein